MDERIAHRKWSPSPSIVVAIILAALCGLAFYLRVYPGYEYAFVGDWVWFRDTDSYYYLRHIESVVHNFPYFNRFDPYTLYPGGGGLGRPFFTWLVAGVALIAGGGSPTPHTVAAVSAYLPPILGTLTLIPVYFIGKELFNRWAGIIAAALVAILPGELFHRSLLGFTDHHIAEALFSTTAALFFVMAVKRSCEITFHHILTRDRSTVAKPLVYALLSGTFLGIYLLIWGGGLMFAFILFTFLVVQFIVDHLRHRSTDYLCIIGVPLFLTTLLVFLVGLGGRVDTFSLLALVAATIVPLVLNTISRFMSARSWKPAYYPLTLLACAGLGLVALRFISFPLFQSLTGGFSFLSPGGAMRTIIEAQPLSMSIAWSNFTTSFILSLIALAILVYITIREKSADKMLFLVWSLIMLVSILGQRRFGYYYTVNAALLTGYLSWKALDLAGLHKVLPEPTGELGKQEFRKQELEKRGFKKREFKKRKKNHGASTHSQTAWARVIATGVIVFLLVFLPNIRPVKALAGSYSIVYASLAQGWHESCLWLRDNTPEPFGDSDYYYQLYSCPPGGYRDFDYPDTMYGVLSWWDYGYFITQIGHRVPNANPGQGGAVQAAQFFTTQNTTTANEIADQRLSKYIMIDHTMPTSKFYAMAEWAGANMSNFYEVYYQQTQSGQLESILLYYPAYYESAVVRLYNFDGQAVIPNESIVISYQDKVDRDGRRYKQISGVWYFDAYDEAEAYIAAQESGNYRIVSAGLFDSPVPLDEMVGYELVYSSPTRVPVAGQMMPGVKIFEYLGVVASSQ